MTALFIGKPGYFSQELSLPDDINHRFSFQDTAPRPTISASPESWQIHKLPTPYEIYCVRSPKGKA